MVLQIKNKEIDLYKIGKYHLDRKYDIEDFLNLDLGVFPATIKNTLFGKSSILV